MDPTLLSRLRTATNMPNDPEDAVIGKAADHMEKCAKGEYLSREDADAAVAAALAPKETKILSLSRDLESAKAGTRVVTVEELAKSVDEDAMEMAAGGVKSRIEALGNRATPGQKKLLMSKLVGEPGARNVIALSKKTANKVGLDATLADIVLSVFEAGDPAEMAKLLKEESGKQRRTELSRDTNPEGEVVYDPKLTEKMVSHMNAAVPDKSPLAFQL